MQSVLDHIAQGVVKFDSSRRLEVWNAQYQEVLQFPHGFLRRGMPVWDMALFLARRGDYGDGDPTRRTAERLELLWNGLPQRIGIKIKDEKIYEVLTRPTEDGGMVITYTDVTDRDRAQAMVEEQRDQLATLNRQKDLLFSVIAHDLRGPFNVLLNMSALMSELGDRLTPEKATEYASAIRDSAGTTFALLENLLDWARLEMDQVAIDPEWVGLRDLVESAAQPLTGAAGLKALRVDTDVPDIQVLVDRQAIATVVRNLLGNAIKYSSPGGTVAVSAGLHGEAPELSVVDRGVGMAPELVERLFACDRIGSREGTQGETGTGLGFLLCRRFVDRHGGILRVDSRPGAGTTVTITIPQPEMAYRTGACA